MYPASFTYYRATSVADAVARLAANPDAKLLAGGYSLIPAMKLRLAQPAELVDLNGVSDLKSITVGADGATIGALATYNEIRDSADLKSAYPILSKAIGVIGDQQVRAHGTIGGCLAHNDPAADLTAAILALGGSVTAQGSSGTRQISCDELFVDLWTTSLELDEVITHVHLPAIAAGTVQEYVKHAHPASGYAVVGVAVVLSVAGGTISSARVTATGAVNKPTRLTAVESALEGNAYSAEVVAAAAAGAAEGLEVNGDHYASAEFRAHLLRVYTRRALEQGMS